MQTLGQTQSLCPECRALVPARVLADDGGVYFQKFCPAHGESRDRVYRDVNVYLKAMRYVKPAWRPLAFGGNAARPCPDGCGMCDRHEQHLCMPIIEITERCDLACPICINSSGPGRDLSLAEFQHILDVLIRAEKQVDVLNLSGGEPLLHPDLLALVDAAREHEGIVRVSLSTNGLRLREQPELLAELAARDVVISLQFDGFDDDATTILRGRPLLAAKQEVLNLLQEQQVSTSLTMTMAGGINDHTARGVLDYLFAHDHVISLMVQPMAFTGRGSQLGDTVSRLSIPDVIERLAQAGHPAVTAADFVPLPCSHPLCFSLAFYLCLDAGGTIALNRLTDAGTMLDSLANRVVFGLDAGEYERMKALIYELWSGPAGSVPDSREVLKTLKGILRKMTPASSCACFDPRRAFTTVERKVKSIFIHAFQDCATFDLARVRRCCQAYPQADGRLLPACVHNNRCRG